MKIQAVEGMIDSNTFIVEGEGSVVIIDAGAKLVDLKSALGKRKPDALLLTHEHYDHVYYIDDYVKEFGIKPADISSEDNIMVGELEIKPILAPGHSPKSVCYLIGDNLFTGDVLFAGSIGRTDFPESNPQEMKATLKKLLDVKFKTAYHGHYEETTYEEQQANIKRFINYF